MSPWSTVNAALQQYSEDFIAALKNPRAAQVALLREILARNENSYLGRKWKFKTIRSYQEFAKNVPVCSYEDIEPYVSLQLGGDSTLCSESVLFVEETSGNSRGKKLIPFTELKLRGFQKALHPWFCDLFSRHPNVQNGRMYWAISPAIRQNSKQALTVPVGIANDALYFGERAAAGLVKQMIGLESSLDQFSDFDEWRVATLVELLLADDLTMISIWSPTFILELMRYLRDHRERVCRELSFRSSARAKLTEGAVGNGTIDTKTLWPRLALLSCWADAGSRRFLTDLMAMFPGVALQPKGLLATEGVVSIPWGAAGGAVPAITSLLIEFIADDGHIYLCDELEVGARYRILLTTFGGLYRYQLGDFVEVKEIFRTVPVLEFVGRGCLVSDLCGEKLVESFVEGCLTEIQGFAMLAPKDGQDPGYALLLDATLVPEETLGEVVRKVELRLCQNPHYYQARELGQLKSLQGFRVSNPLSRYETLRSKAGQRIGTLKPLALSNQASWLSEFMA